MQLSIDLSVMETYDDGTSCPDFTPVERYQHSLSGLSKIESLFIHSDMDDDLIRQLIRDANKYGVVRFSGNLMLAKIEIAARAIIDANKKLILLLTDSLDEQDADHNIELRAFGEHCRLFFVSTAVSARLDQTIVPTNDLAVIVSEDTPDIMLDCVARALNENEILRVTQDSNTELSTKIASAMGKSNITKIPASTQRSQRIHTGIKKSVSFTLFDGSPKEEAPKKSSSADDISHPIDEHCTKFRRIG